MPMFYYIGGPSLYLVQHPPKPWVKDLVNTYSIACSEIMESFDLL